MSCCQVSPFHNDQFLVSKVKTWRAGRDSSLSGEKGRLGGTLKVDFLYDRSWGVFVCCAIALKMVGPQPLGTERFEGGSEFRPVAKCPEYYKK